MSSPSAHSKKNLDLSPPVPTASAEGRGAAAGGGLDAGAIYDLHAETITRWAARLAGPGIDVEDIVQEVFLVALRRLGEFRGDAKITTWLYEITVRVVQERRRSQRRWRWLYNHRGVPSGGAPPITADEVARVAADQPTALELLERKEATVLLYQVLDGLSEKYRTAIILFELEGLSGEEIAAVTATSLSNVWVRLLRGRKQFLKRLLAREAKRTHS
jgi:RNA polymerase sigma-70 factor (ECF subfamily)